MSTKKKAKKPGADGDHPVDPSQAADNDLQLLQQLEQAIGRKLNQRNLEEVLKCDKVGYALAGAKKKPNTGSNISKASAKIPPSWWCSIKSTKTRALK